VGSLGGLAGPRPSPGVSASSVLPNRSRTCSAGSGPNLGPNMLYHSMRLPSCRWPCTKPGYHHGQAAEKVSSGGPGA
jgi:hypothetical protein